MANEEGRGRPQPRSPIHASLRRVFASSLFRLDGQHFQILRLCFSSSNKKRAVVDFSRKYANTNRSTLVCATYYACVPASCQSLDPLVTTADDGSKPHFLPD